MKTEYRIVPITTFIADKYLQFKLVQTKMTWLGKIKTVEEWCFIPQTGYPKVHGYWLTQEACPTSLPFMHEAEFLNSFYDQESYELIPFTKEYPDIEKYFEYLRSLRKGYLEQERVKREDTTIRYL